MVPGADKSLLESIRIEFSAAMRRAACAPPARSASRGWWSRSRRWRCAPPPAFAQGARRGRLASPAARSLGLAGVLGSGFAIGAAGWSFAWLSAAFGAAAAGQPGIGWGGALTLLSLVMLLGCGLARLGRFRGDVFVAGAVVVCGALLLLFVALPVARGAGRRRSSTMPASSRSPRSSARIGNERTWGLACLAGGVRCGVAWNTLFLAAAHGGGHDRCSARMIALVAERGAARLKAPLQRCSRCCRSSRRRSSSASA